MMCIFVHPEQFRDIFEVVYSAESEEELRAAEEATFIDFLEKCEGKCVYVV